LTHFFLSNCFLGEKRKRGEKKTLGCAEKKRKGEGWGEKRPKI